MWLQSLRRLPLPPRQDGASSVTGSIPPSTRRLRLFILSNAGFSHVNTCLKHALGSDWLDLFDAVFVEGRKSSLFSVYTTQLSVSANTAAAAGRVQARDASELSIATGIESPSQRVPESLPTPVLSNTGPADVPVGVSAVSSHSARVPPCASLTRAALFSGRSTLRPVDHRTGRSTAAPMPAQAMVGRSDASVARNLGYGGGVFTSNQTLAAGGLSSLHGGVQMPVPPGATSAPVPADIRAGEKVFTAGSFTDLQV